MAGPQLKIRVLRVPAGERGVMLGDGLVGIRSCGTRRVQVQVILEDLQIGLLEPRLEKPGLPEPGQVVDGVGRLRFFTPAYCVLATSDPKTGGGPRRKSWAEVITHGFQEPARGVTGVLLLHTPGKGG